jgi:transposase
MFPPLNTRIYLASGNTDMRKAINGLSILVQDQLEMDPLSGHLFVFCNRRRDIVKALYWDRNGFCLWQKRLEKHRFKWPESAEQVLQVDVRQLSWLLEGLDFTRVNEVEALADEAQKSADRKRTARAVAGLSASVKKSAKSLTTSRRGLK